MIRRDPIADTERPTAGWRLQQIAAAGLIAALALLPPPGEAAVPDIARKAFANMPAVTGQWAFTRTRTDNEGVRVERFDPSTESKWSLVSIDGREPGTEELADYAEEVRERLAREAGRPGDNDFANLADEQGWELVEEDQRRIVYRFRPAPGATDRAEMAKHLGGEMTILKSVPYVESFRLYSHGPFRARVVAKIEHFSTRIRMTRLDDRAYMPERIVTEVRGSAFGLKSIDRDIELAYTDFRYAGTKAAAGGDAPAAD